MASARECLEHYYNRTTINIVVSVINACQVLYKQKADEYTQFCEEKLITIRGNGVTDDDYSDESQLNKKQKMKLSVNFKKSLKCAQWQVKRYKF